ncbi:hypothetical protein Tco_0959321 [Tanacetum coccineum]
MLQDMIMKKFKLEANYPLNLSAKLPSFDDIFDITDDNEEKFMSFKPDIPETPLYKSKPMISKEYKKETEVKVGNIFDNKEALVLAIRLKALDEGYQFLSERSNPDSASIRTFMHCLHLLLIIDATHLKSQYKGTNPVAVGMDGNNQIVPIAFGICKGETDMIMKKFKLEANYPLNLSAKLPSFDNIFDITDDNEVRFFVECACNSKDEIAHLYVSQHKAIGDTTSFVENTQENMFFNFFEPTTLENIGPSNDDVSPTIYNNNNTSTSLFNNGLSLNFGPSDFQNNDSRQKNESHFEKPESSFAFGDYNEYEDKQTSFDNVVHENPQPNYHKWEKFMSFKPDIPETPLYKSKPMISKEYKKETEVKVDSYVHALSTPVPYNRCGILKGSIQGNKSSSCGHGWKQSDYANCFWHAAIALAVHNEFPLAFHVTYTPEEFSTEMINLRTIQPDAYHKRIQVGPQRWSKAYCPLVRYNYMTLNSVESVNACTVLYRKLPVLKLAETYRAMVQEWYFKRRELADNMTSKITEWVANKVNKKRMKSATWHVYGVNHYQYQVSDGRYNRKVDFQTCTCQCRKWQLSGIPYGHVIAVTRFLGMTDCVQFVADWFKKEKYQGTYAESIHFLGNIQEWEFPHHIQKAIPPKMDNPQPGRPKNTNQIKSQGEEPRSIHCSRCRQAGHRRDQCNKPIVAEPPVNTRTRNDQEFPRNEQPSFYDPHQQYDNTFQGYNQYASQPYSQTTYPSQPYDQHHTNTSQAYDGNHTHSDQMYDQYDSQQNASPHLDDLNTDGSNSWVNMFGF